MDERGDDDDREDGDGGGDQGREVAGHVEDEEPRVHGPGESENS